MRTASNRAAGAALRVAAAASLLLAAGCGDSFGLFAVDGVEEIEPRTVWFEWYQDVEECAGADGSFTEITWYRAEYIANSNTRERHAGLFRPPHDIFLARGRQASEFTVRHEMVHEVLGLRDPRHTHSNPAFERCVGEAIQQRSNAARGPAGS